MHLLARFYVALIQARSASECISGGFVMHLLAPRACISAGLISASQNNFDLPEPIGWTLRTVCTSVFEFPLRPRIGEKIKASGNRMIAISRLAKHSIQNRKRSCDWVCLFV